MDNQRDKRIEEIRQRWSVYKGESDAMWLLAEVDRLQQQRDEYQAVADKFSADVKEGHNRWVKLQKEYADERAAHNSQKAELSEENALLKEDHTQMRAEIRAMREERDNLQKDNDDYRAGMVKAVETINRYEKLHDKTTAEITKWFEEAMKMKEERDDLEHRLERVERAGFV